MSATPNTADRDHLDRTLRTLEQCALHKRTLRLRCPVCACTRVLDGVALWWLFHRRGWDDRLPGAVRKRLFCEACLAKAERRVRPELAITREPPEGPQPPYPSESEWKRIVARYRS